ncbi:hypothetical protein BOX15_Mlig010752g1 [Macrostomum lignano]|uniref:Uncharacterized protein n=1 Tax=Macrostomum lignano TaxID=282301 RepID=A0A267H506_9PLAT|nr:hypothetical protein BOX15_Mlig010752g1 [Macrostomum lignano]
MKGYHFEIFVKDLIDEGYLSNDISISAYLNDTSKIGESNLKLYDPDNLYCSVNQTLLSNWQWLLGGSPSNVESLLCVGIKSFVCKARHISLFPAVEEVMMAFNTVFAVANLLTLAIWCRFKEPKPQTPTRPEVGIQLLLLRFFSAFSLAACFVYIFFGSSPVTTVNSVASAVIISVARWIVVDTATIFMFFTKTSAAFSLITATFLIEYSHPGQKLLLFTTKKRALAAFFVLFVTLLLLSFAMSTIYGYIYCPNEDSLLKMKLRISHRLHEILYDRMNILHAVLLVLSVILLIVFASKRCCACCRCDGSYTHSESRASESVAYLTQLEDSEQSESEANESAVVLQAGNSSELLANELRRLIFWQQVVLVLPQLVFIVKFHSLRLVENSFGKFQLIGFGLIAAEALFVAAMPVVTPIVSPTFRRGLASATNEVKNYLPCRLP